VVDNGILDLAAALLGEPRAAGAKGWSRLTLDYLCSAYQTQVIKEITMA
jgi:hypothetical protein